MKSLQELIKESTTIKEAKKEPHEIAFDNFWKLFNLYIKESDRKFNDLKKSQNQQLDHIKKKANELSSFLNKGIEFLIDVNEGFSHDLSNASEYNKAVNELKSLK